MNRLPQPTLKHSSCGCALEKLAATDLVSRSFSTRPAAAPWKSSPRAGLVSPQEPGGSSDELF
jgi:hypothetical protein